MGRFVWYELLTTDPAGAQDFYPAVTGWVTQVWEGGQEDKPPYTMWTAGGAPMGGLWELPEEARDQGAPPHWMGYVGVDDVDVKVERARELGARVLAEAQDVPDVGRFAILMDPQGAPFAVYRPHPDSQQTEPVSPDGRVSWHELATTDHESAWSFYNDLFGWQRVDSHDMGDGWMYEIFGHEGDELPTGGMFTKNDDMPGPPAWLYYVHVADLDGALEAVRQNGGQILNGPMEVPGGDRVAQCMDPQGAMFALHARGG